MTKTSGAGADGGGGGDWLMATATWASRAVAASSPNNNKNNSKGAAPSSVGDGDLLVAASQTRAPLSTPLSSSSLFTSKDAFLGAAPSGNEEGGSGCGCGSCMCSNCQCRGHLRPTHRFGLRLVPRSRSAASEDPFDAASQRESEWRSIQKLVQSSVPSSRMTLLPHDGTSDNAFLVKVAVEDKGQEKNALVRSCVELIRKYHDYDVVECSPDVDSTALKAVIKVSMELSGLHCASCAETVELAVRELHGVVPSSISAQLKPDQRVSLLYDSNSITATAIQDKIESLGFQVKSVKADYMDGPPNDQVKATFLIHGMTCSTCLATVENGLGGMDGVDSVVASFLPQHVTVVFTPTKVLTSSLRSRIVDLGYEVLSETIKPVDKISLAPSDLTAVQSTQPEEPDLATVNFNVVGMTCASCVAGIEAAVSDMDGVKKIGVSLLTNRAIIEYDPRTIGPRKLMEQINDMGYEATPAPEVDSSALSKERYKKELDNYRNLTIAAFMFALPTIIVSMVFGMALPESNPIREGLMKEVLRGLSVEAFIGFLLSTPTQFVIGRRFYKGAYKSLRYAKSANMDVLVALGTSAAYFYSLGSIVYTTASQLDPEDQYFETSTLLIFFILLGKYLEAYAKEKTSYSLSSLLALKSQTATVVELNSAGDVAGESEIQCGLLHVGDFVRVTAGSRIPCDGVIYYGSSSVDESMLTGEPMPLTKGPNDLVTSGTMNLTGPIIFKATRVGSETSLSRILKMVEEAQSSKAPVQAVADAVSRVFVPSVVAASLATFIGWIVATKVKPDLVIEGSTAFGFSLQFAIAVLVIACPCALGLATPTAVMVGTGIAARCGILVKGGGASLETAHKVRTVLLDKTGTITSGSPTVTDLKVSRSIATNPIFSTEKHILYLLNVVESSSKHPLAAAIASHTSIAAGDCAGLEASIKIQDVAEIAGKGMEAVVDSGAQGTFQVRVGNKLFVLGQDGSGGSTEEEQELLAQSVELQKLGRTTVFVGISVVDGAAKDLGAASKNACKLVAVVGVADPVRPSSASAIRAIRELGIRVVMVTGDNDATARAVAASVGIPSDDVFAGCLPEQKSKIVENCKAAAGKGWKVAFAGDGINDAIALAKADIGIAIASGSDVAVETGDIVLLKSDLFDVLTLFRLSRSVLSRIHLNLFGAFFYNVVGIPIAAGVLYPATGVRLAPWMAGLAMALSSVTVVVSSLMLRLFRPTSR
ncbi:E1-E2 ATPase-domain-containing protein [Zopfochytrium polystomum]|nr:E1-E2 ATPase-domain-containing protein [Zopfochytrium polystomum]